MEFPQLMRHLRSKACAEIVGEEKIAQLRELFKQRSAKQKADKYNKSAKGLARQAAYEKTEKGAARQGTYEKTAAAAARKAAYGRASKEANYTATKLNQNVWKAAERSRKRKADADKISQLVKATKKMKLVTAEDRRIEFQRATLLSADFVCVCCHDHYFRQTSPPP